MGSQSQTLSPVITETENHDRQHREKFVGPLTSFSDDILSRVNNGLLVLTLLFLSTKLKYIFVARRQVRSDSQFDC